MRITMAAVVLLMGFSMAASAAVVMPPATQPNGEPLWMPGGRLPRPGVRETRTRLGRFLLPIPPRAGPSTMHRLDRENSVATLPAERYWRSWLPYYQLTLGWGGPRGFVVDGVDSPDSERYAGP